MIITLTICYNNHDVVEKSIDRYYEFCYYKPDIHFIVDNEYPLNKDQLKETLKKLSYKYGCIILEPNKNLGIKNGANWGLDQLYLNDNDKIILYDSNAYPLNKNFDKALIDVLENNEDIVGACLTRKNINNLERKQDKNFKYSYFDDANYFFGSSIGIFNYFIHKHLKFDIDLFNNNYGDAVNLHDSKLKRLVKNMNKKVIFLSDFNEDLGFYNKYQDNDYTKYKTLAINYSLSNFTLEEYILNKNKYNKLSLINSHIKKINGFNLF